jgi:hypothetical protein
MEENCIGSQSPQRTVVLEKNKKKKTSACSGMNHTTPLRTSTFYVLSCYRRSTVQAPA